MMKINYRLMGRRIAAKRAEMKLTQEKAAEKCGISVQYLSRIERGSGRPSLAKMVDIANALGATLDELLCDSIAADSAIIAREANEIFSGCTPEEVVLLNEELRSLRRFMKEAEKLE